MPEYRKIGSRTFYKRSEYAAKSTVTKVVNKLFSTEVAIISNWMNEDEIFGEEANSNVKPCTEEEFNAAKSEAMKRLQSEQI